MISIEAALVRAADTQHIVTLTLRSGVQMTGKVVKPGAYDTIELKPWFKGEPGEPTLGWAAVRIEEIAAVEAQP